MAITFDVAEPTVNIYTPITDAANALYSYTVTRGFVVCDVWAQVIGAASGGGGNTVQVQTVGGGANVTATIGFNAQARGTIVPTTTVLSANSTFATGGTMCYNVVRAAAPNGIAVNTVCLPA